LKWKQRAKENWLQFGYRNSSFFHASAKQKNRRSTMKQIRNKEGQICSTKEDIEGDLLSYFSELFTKGENLEVTACVELLATKVTLEMNKQFLSEFTIEEISAALQQMSPLKIPRPDGYSACFYQHNWSTIHPEVCASILSFLNSGTMDQGINVTHIALIPKVDFPGCVTDFQPISLCNVIYKLISKVLANRLKVVLPKIISYYQSAFILERMINDNIIAAYETMHSMQTRMWSKVGFMGIKIDMSKSYDRIEWDFLEAAMLRLGFDARWVYLIMACVRSISYSVVVNGNPVGPFSSSRGIRQGDPISPYLFLICAEVFSSLLLKAKKRGVIIRVPTSPRGPSLNHLFFAEDSLLFCKANSVEWRRLLKILGIYETGSGQKLNLSKTSIFFFSRNTPLERKQEILQQFGLVESTRIESYLSIPTFIGKSKHLAFQDIVESVTKRLSNWKIKFPS
jgi:hypothetical protein